MTPDEEYNKAKELHERAAKIMRPYGDAIAVAYNFLKKLNNFVELWFYFLNRLIRHIHTITKKFSSVEKRKIPAERITQGFRTTLRA